MSRDYFSLSVFHERESEAILKKLNLLEKLENGQVRCIVCNKTITLENFGGVLKKENRILIVCDDLECLKKVEELRNVT